MVVLVVCLFVKLGNVFEFYVGVSYLNASSSRSSKGRITLDSILMLQNVLGLILSLYVLVCVCAFVLFYEYANVLDLRGD